MKLLNDSVRKFNLHLPVYNWLYPAFVKDSESAASGFSVFQTIDYSAIKSRALYFHIPFCETICSFCPFVKTAFRDYSFIEEYVQAIINEITIKSYTGELTRTPVEVIFFGGGTPSLLSPEQILRIGQVIHSTFDTTRLKEFSFEIEVKSITAEKLEAMRSIGVTHGRFGLQTFNKKYRDFFNLTASLTQIRNAVLLMKEYLPFVSFDMIYGINGQSDEEFLSDIDQAVALNTANIDFYPLNNYVSQIALHNTFRNNGLFCNSPMRKIEMNMLLRKRMYDHGFLPHNGHGFYKASRQHLSLNPVVSGEYTFHYHKHVYGCNNHDLLGFGTSAVSVLNGVTVINNPSRHKYISSLKSYTLDYTIGKQDSRAFLNRGLLMHLPYFGFLNKDQIEWSDTYPETQIRLSALIEHGLVQETEHQFKLTLSGWYWYVNLMYYLSPSFERDSINKYIENIASDKKRIVELSQIE
jgi:coproporphyrinogen III oxidase-like Fe-S oxidoreductase